MIPDRKASTPEVHLDNSITMDVFGYDDPRSFESEMRYRSRFYAITMNRTGKRTPYLDFRDMGDHNY